MGFTERGDISKLQPDCCWKELVTPCCHCVTFKQDRPLKKKLLSYSSHHDPGIAERYKCQSLWKAGSYQQLGEKQKTTTSLKKRRKEEGKDVTDYGTHNKKPKSNVTGCDEGDETPADVTPDTPVPADVTPDVPVSEVFAAPDAVIMPLHKVIKDLEAKLMAKYVHDLSTYKAENDRLEERVSAAAAVEASSLSVTLEEKEQLALL